jgi:hypothetical protein
MTAPTPFIRLPFNVPGTAAHVLDAALVAPMFPSIAELEATGHWIFSSANPTMADLLSGQLMVANADAPVMSAGYMTLANGASNHHNNGLKTPYDDRTSYTMCMVFRIAVGGTGRQVVYGNNAGTTGDYLLQQPQDAPHMLLLSAGLPNANGPETTISYPSGAANGDWVFLAVTYDLAGNLNSNVAGRTLYFGNSGGSPLTQTGLKLPAATKIAIGNVASGNNTDLYRRDISFAELIFFATPQSQAEVARIYARSQARLLSENGITVY